MEAPQVEAMDVIDQMAAEVGALVKDRIIKDLTIAALRERVEALQAEVDMLRQEMDARSEGPADLFSKVD